MSRLLPEPFATAPPTPDDIRLARELRQRLTAPSLKAQVSVTVQVEGQAPCEPIVLPAPVLDLMLRVLAEVSQGHAVAVTPVPQQESGEDTLASEHGTTPEEDVRFPEESLAPLSDRDRDRLLDLLDHPPPPNAALLKAARRVQGRD